MSITIKELTDVAAASGGLTKRAAEKVVADVFAKIGAALKEKEEVTIRDFGRFYTKTYDPRMARNPRSGEPVEVGERTVIKFAPRGSMK